MDLFRELRRPGIIPVIGMVLGAYYFLVLLPVQRKAASLDVPLQNSWRKLAAALEQTNTTAIDFLRITNQLYETRQALRQLEEAKGKAMARIEVGSTMRSRMQSPFQLVDYEEERSARADALRKLAKEKSVSLEPAVFAGFPEHTAEAKQPSLLWAALMMIDSLLNTAVRCNVSKVHALEVPLNLTHAAPSSATTRLAEVPIQVEITGSVTNIATLLLSLPLRTEELPAAGLPASTYDKPPLFLDRLVIQKQSPEKTDEVRVWVRLVGFVFN